MTFLKVEATGLRQLGRELRAMRPEIYRTVQKALRAAGEEMAEDARERASWSTRIPGTIKVSASGIDSIVLKAGGGKNSTAPHAAAYEHAGAEGTFRHPVHGDPTLTRDEWTWVREEARPFLLPAVMENLDGAANLVADTVAATLQTFFDAEGE